MLTMTFDGIAELRNCSPVHLAIDGATATVTFRRASAFTEAARQRRQWHLSRHRKNFGPNLDLAKLTFSVEGTGADSTDPVLTSANPESGATLQAGERVRIRWTVTDGSPIKLIHFWFVDPYGDQRAVTSYTGTTAGNESSGITETATNQTWPRGTYQFTHVEIADIAGNVSDTRTGNEVGPDVDLTKLTFDISAMRLNDFNGDSKTDVIARDSTGQTPGDFDGDTKADLIARDTSGGLWLYPGTGTGDWSKRVSLGSGWNVMTSIVGPGNFNHDGRPDLIARDSSGQLWLYPSNGAGDWNSRVDLGAGWNIMTSIVAPGGDFDGYGRADFLARDTSGRFWLYVRTSDDLARRSLGDGWNTHSAITAPGDLNSDGRPDVIARDKTGELWLYPNNGAGDWFTRIDLGPGWNQMTAIL